MSRLRSLVCGSAAVLGAIVGPCLLTPAYADTTDLFCHQSGYAPEYGLNVSIDASASTVTAWFSTFNRGDVTPISATITNDQVTWTYQTPAGTDRYTLDRNSGELNDLPTNGRTILFACKKTTRVF